MSRKSMAKAKSEVISPMSDPSTDRKTMLYETLRRRIVSMELAPSAVVDEMALCEEFGLSRPPVREMMRQLAAEGYIELETNRPARVAPMSYQSLRSFFLAAPLIYVAMSQLAAKLATPEDVDRLRAIQKNFKDAIEEKSTEGRVLYNDQFHFAIGHIARNVYLMPSLRRLLIDHARLGKVFYRAPATDDMRRDLELAVIQHDQIIDAIERHDVDSVGEIVRAHMDLSRRRMTEYVIPEALDTMIRF